MTLRNIEAMAPHFTNQTDGADYGIFRNMYFSADVPSPFSPRSLSRRSRFSPKK